MRKKFRGIRKKTSDSEVYHMGCMASYQNHIYSIIYQTTNAAPASTSTAKAEQLCSPGINYALKSSSENFLTPRHS